LINIWQAAALVTCRCNQFDLDPDIAGFGVRFAIYVSRSVTGFAALLGHFYGKITGMKDISLGLFVTVAIYTLNLLKGCGSGVLDNSSTLIAAMMLDTLVLVLSITFSMKECLSAYKTTMFCFLLQSASLIITMLAVDGFSRESRSSEDNGCTCFRVHQWISIMDTCAGPPFDFWLYYSPRVLGWVHDLWLCYQHVPDYHAAKKTVATDPESISVQADISETMYDSIPATAFTKYREWLAAFVGSAICVELTLRAHGLQGARQWQSWG